MPFDFSVSDIIPANPQAIYEAWLSSDGHEKMTGGKPAQRSAQQGGTFTAPKFSAADPDSEIEVLLEPAPGGTRITVRHSNVPDGHTSYRDGGWQRSYFEPMKEYFKRAR